MVLVCECRYGCARARARQARGLSQEAFADLVGVHRTYMGGLERGERNLTLRSVERIAEQIGIDPLTLMDPRSEKRPRR